MRLPVNPLPGQTLRWSSVAISLTFEVFESMPGSVGSGGLPWGTLDITGGTLTDDASQNISRRMTLEAGELPDALKPGMWLRPTVGVQTVQPIIYRFPSMVITDITEDLTKLNGARLELADPSQVLNEQPYESDTVLTGTLRSLVQAACAGLSRPPDVSTVPTTAVPLNTVAEFGSGRWDTCIKIGDDLGVGLRFNDVGDVIGRVRTTPAPAPVAQVEKALVGGECHHVRTPSRSKVLVTRGNDIIGLMGSAKVEDVTGIPPPAWYPSFVVTDRQEGDSTTTQAQANELAKQLMVARLSEIDAFQDLPILPSPWLEAAADVVSLKGTSYWVRSVSFEMPSMATTVTLRKVY